MPKQHDDDDESENPIKRKPFTPSKTFQKQFPQAQKRIEQAIVKRVSRQFANRPAGDTVDRIAVLANELGGIDEVANLLDVDTTMLDDVVMKGRLNIRQERDIVMGYDDLYRNKKLTKRLNLDMDRVELGAAVLKWARSDVPGRGHTRIERILSYAVAEGAIDIIDLMNGHGVLADLPAQHKERIFETWLSEYAEGNNLPITDMFKSYVADHRDIWSRDLQDSEFWEWFRTYVYPTEQ